MNSSDIAFLKELCEAPSPSGYEWPAAEVFRRRLTGTADSIETSVMGSVHATLLGKGKGKKKAPSVMIAGHIDEIGFMVKYIDDNGYITFDAIGGIDSAILPGSRVTLYATGKGTGGPTKPTVLRGMIGRKPIHLIEADERKNVTPMEKLIVDLGLSGEQARELIRIGDCFTFGLGFEEYGDGFAASRAFDDKMGAFICARVMEEIAAAKKAKGDLYAVATVQEEIGTRGAITSTFSLDPDIGISVEVDHATDYPGIEKSRYSEVNCGKGPVIARGPNINPMLFERLVAAAEAADVEYQIGPEPRGTGTDANPMQITKSGKVAGLVSVPLRYMHTPSEVLKLDDLDSTIRLLTRFILDLEPDIDWIPR